MATPTPLTINGIDPHLSPALTLNGCRIRTHKRTMSCVGDEVINEIPVGIMEWLTDNYYAELGKMTITENPVNVGDDCSECVVVTGDVPAYYAQLPCMVQKCFSSGEFNFLEAKRQYCRFTGIDEKTCNVVDFMGNPNTQSEQYADFITLFATPLYEGFRRWLTDMIADGSCNNTGEFDGLYTQLENGWLPSGALPPLPDSQNKATIIDWSVLTGGSMSPEAITIATSFLLWGVSIPVPAGLNWSEFVTTILLPTMQAYYPEEYNAASAWELHYKYGDINCLSKMLACFRLCGTEDLSANETLAQYQAALRTRVLMLKPTDTPVITKSSTQIESNTLWFGPGRSNGNPTYGLFFAPLGEWAGYPDITNALRQQGYNLTQPLDWINELFLDDSQSKFDPMRIDDIAFSSNIDKVGLRCLKFSLEARAGLLALCRHMWVKFENISCGTAIPTCP